MGENNEQNNEKKMNISVEIDPEYIESKNQEITNLKTENEELKTALETVAEKELRAKCEKYGIDQELDDEIKIQKVKEAEINGSKNLSGITSDMLYGNNGSRKSTLSGEYDSVGEMVADLTRKAKDSRDPDSPVAEAILKELGKKELQAVKTHGRENFVGDIDPAELKRLREDSKRDIAKKRLRQ